MRRIYIYFSIMFLTCLSFAQNGDAQETSTHGVAMYGEPALDADYKRFAYTGSAARKGGTLRHAKTGSFDSLNPFASRGKPAEDIRNFVFESLMARHLDEPFALYGLLAESIEMPAGRDWVRFRLRREARFSDGMLLTADDVIFSWRRLRDAGRPNHRAYYSKVVEARAESSHSVLFRFDAALADYELPLIIGLMPILPKHFFENRDVSAPSLDIPLGSNAYIIDSYQAGRQIIFVRNVDYWGRGLPFARGRFNFDRLIHDYYQDESAAFEAFKTGASDVWFENNPQRWLNGYNFAAVRKGQIRQRAFVRGTASGLYGIVLNTRRGFADKRVRQAMDLLFDFEWVNKTLYNSAYTRTQSYFGNSPLSAYGVKASPAEKQLLANANLSDVIIERGYHAPQSTGRGYNRQNRRRALNLLKAAGYRFEGTKLYHPDGRPVQFELLVRSRDQERLALAYAQMLARNGITLNVRLVDSSQYQARLQGFDFDMIIYNYYASLSPGNEQAHYWSRKAAKTHGSRNYAGIQNLVIDTAISALTRARDKQAFQTAARALDRTLMGEHYIIPLFHKPQQWLAHWQHIKMPPRPSLYGAQSDSWWHAQK